MELEDKVVVILEEDCITKWFHCLSLLDFIRIKDEESFRRYVNIYLTILDIRSICEIINTEQSCSIRKMCNEKVIRMHGKINSLTMTKYKSLRHELFGDA